jgi:hydrogenase maturation protease
MNFERVEKIAEAVLYEGYMLYPYRASAVKNQQRWNFGVLCPRSYSEQQRGTEAWIMQTECLLEAKPSTQLNIEIRFLQIVNRSIGRCPRPSKTHPQSEEPAFALVDKLVAGGRTMTPWQEAMERKLTITGLRPAAFSLHRHSFFEFPAKRELEPIENARNLTDHELHRQDNRTDALRHSFVSAHIILGAEDGRFVSQLDPPEGLRSLASGCVNIGTWPVLAGENGSREAVLSSPIILYDYPQIAPESPGSLFDGTEIDEILSLRILTMTDEEKREMRQSDERAREILERTENMPPEQFMKLHGVLRGVRPLFEETQ